MRANSGRPTPNIGKLPQDILVDVIGKLRAFISPSTLIPPGIGEDAAIIPMPGTALAVHVDPISEAVAGAGRLSVIVASNDVSVTGACPKWGLLTMLLPEHGDPDLLDTLVSEIALEAGRIGLDIIGGHTEITPGLSRPLLVLTVIGTGPLESLTPTRNVKPGDAIVQVGYAGGEGTAIILNDFKNIIESKCPGLTGNRADQTFNISIVEPACKLASTGLVHAMHDATEGGIIGALVEMAIASGLEIRVSEDKIPVHPTTKAVAECLGLDPLKLISSGAFLAAVAPRDAEKVVSTAIEAGYPASIVGRAVKSGKPGLTIKRIGGKVETYFAPPPDEIGKLWVAEDGAP